MIDELTEIQKRQITREVLGKKKLGRPQKIKKYLDDKHRTTVVLTIEEVKRLKEYAEMEERSVQFLMRQSVKEYLRKLKRKYERED